VPSFRLSWHTVWPPTRRGKLYFGASPVCCPCVLSGLGLPLLPACGRALNPTPLPLAFACICAPRNNPPSYQLRMSTSRANLAHVSSYHKHGLLKRDPCSILAHARHRLR